MEFRLATRADLPAIQQTYRALIAHMDQMGTQIWDDSYPCQMFPEDVEARRLYVLLDGGEAVSAFALTPTHQWVDACRWQAPEAKALYMSRLGVKAKNLRQGIGSLMLRRAVDIAREAGAEWLRLFVVDENLAAQGLYRKFGLRQAEGGHDLVLSEDLRLRELGFEIKITKKDCIP